MHFQNKSFPSEINFENKYTFFIITHFPSGDAKMKKVLLFHACKINISATTDILRITVINQNEKLGLIASLVHHWSTCQAEMSSHPKYWSAQLLGVPKRQNKPRFNKYILTVWPNVRIEFSQFMSDCKALFQTPWWIQRARQPRFHFHESCNPLGKFKLMYLTADPARGSSKYTITFPRKEVALRIYTKEPHKLSNTRTINSMTPGENSSQYIILLCVLHVHSYYIVPLFFKN